MEEKKVIIEAVDLVKTYGEDEGLMYALNHVSLKVYEHEFLVIVGGSGSGKSTLLNMLGAIDKVDSGSIIVNGNDITKYNNKKLTLYRRYEIGFIYQFFNLINDVTVYQNVTLAPGTKNKERALGLLDRVGLLDKKHKFPRQLSGGQQQRVAIARALNKESNILLCDEPTGALDDASGKAILKLLEEIHAEGKTIVLVTHTKEIAQMADRIITMKDGKIVHEEINTNIVKAEEVNW
ncbi:MAG: ABC transporter ATP-binding protein [Bacilli bacterium]|nr:ABC transporter ATP-binding protein [Bacilli bacterium]